MRFEWDEAKRQANIARHGLDFVDVESVFASQMFSLIDDRLIMVKSDSLLWEYGVDKSLRCLVLKTMKSCGSYLSERL